MGESSVVETRGSNYRKTDRHPEEPGNLRGQDEFQDREAEKEQEKAAEKRLRKSADASPLTRPRTFLVKKRCKSTGGSASKPNVCISRTHLRSMFTHRTI